MKRPPGKDMLHRSRRLRREITPQEAILWRALRSRRFEGFKFRRQMWLVGFIADFACPQARLVVEADGSQHAENPDYDLERGLAFERIGWRTLRFWNNEINENLEGVLISIREALALTLPPGCAGRGPPSPLKGEGIGTRHAPPLPFGEREGPKPSGLGG
jgi:very-short-patch-repair endonuclease